MSLDNVFILSILLMEYQIWVSEVHEVGHLTSTIGSPGTVYLLRDFLCSLGRDQ